MKRYVRSLILLLVVFLTIPVASTAQEFRYVELNAFIAGSAHTKTQYELGFPQSSTPLRNEFRLDDVLRGGLRFNVNTTGHLGEEFFFSYEPNNARFRGVTLPSVAD